MDENLGVPSPPDDNPEMSRRGAFAAGGLALAALVAGGCGWLAMNAKKGDSANATLSSKIVDTAPTEAFSGYAAAVDQEGELFEKGISASHAQLILADTPYVKPKIDNAKTAYVEFSYDSFEPNRPYLFVANAFVDKWSPDDAYDGEGAVEYGPDGKPAYISSRTFIGRAGKVVVPSSSSGRIATEIEVPVALDNDESFFTLCGWNLLDIH